MQIQDIGKLQRNLSEFSPEGIDYYPVTELHGYVAHFAGGNAGERLLHDLLSNEGRSPAKNYFSSTAVANETNQTLLFFPKTIIDGNGNERVKPDLNNPRTTAEFFEFLAKEKGLSDRRLPDFTNWSTIRTQITAQMANIEPVTVAKVTSLVYSQRPVHRPEGLGATLAEAASPKIESPSGAVSTSKRPIPRPITIETASLDN